MPIETELHDLFAGSASPSIGIDTAAVIRRSKRRRLPQQLGVGSAMTLAVAGIGIAGFGGIRPLVASTSTGVVSEPMSDGAANLPGSYDGELVEGEHTDPGRNARAENLNLCAETVAERQPSPTSLVLETHFPESAPANGQDVVGTVTLSNTGAKTVTGTTAAIPVVTLSQDSITQWHSNGPMIMLAVIVDLAPGESLEYTASFTPVRCDVEDELAGGFRDDLPALAPGEYQLSAAIDLTIEGQPAALVTGPASAISLLP